jgi:hypothetical protein
VVGQLRAAHKARACCMKGIRRLNGSNDQNLWMVVGG